MGAPRSYAEAAGIAEKDAADNARKHREDGNATYAPPPQQKRRANKTDNTETWDAQDLGISSIDPSKIHLKIREGTTTITGKRFKREKIDIIDISVLNNSNEKIDSFGIGYIVGKPKLFSTPQIFRAQFDDEKFGSFEPGQERTIQIPRVMGSQYSVGTDISGVTADGKAFHQKRKPKVFRPKTFARSFAKGMWIAAAAIWATSAALVHFAPNNTATKKPTSPSNSAVPQHEKKQEHKSALTNAILTKDFTVLLNAREETCVLSAGTKLNDKGAAPKLWKEARHLVIIPSIEGSCKGKISPKAEQGIPADIIQKTNTTEKKQLDKPTRTSGAYALQSVSYSANKLG